MSIKDKIQERLGEKIVSWQEKTSRRVYFTIKKEDVLEAVRFLFKELGMRFVTASAVETPKNFEILYHFSFDQTGEIYSIRALIEDKNNPQIEAITPIFIGAEWMEREMWEMFGINFIGHPNLKRLLLADDWPQGDYPLRKK